MNSQEEKDSNEDFQKFRQMSDEERRKHEQYVLYLSFIRMGITRIDSETKKRFTVDSEKICSERAPIPLLNEEFQKFRQMCEADQKKHPQYALYLAFIRMGLTKL